MNDKIVFRLILVISIVVFLVVAILQSKLITIFPVASVVPEWVLALPKVNAILNGTCTFLLLVSLYYIKKKDIAMHKILNSITFILSSLFLVSYVIYHYQAPHTSFGGHGFIRSVYFFILITHIILAAVVVPFVLLSIYFAISLQIDKHKKLVKWTFPIWLYVAISGVVVYWMIKPYYQTL